MVLYGVQRDSAVRVTPDSEFCVVVGGQSNSKSHPNCILFDSLTLTNLLVTLILGVILDTMILPESKSEAQP